MKVLKTSHGLVGKYLHTLDENGEIDWQGRIIGMDGDMARVQLFSWWFGEPTNVVLIPESVLYSEDQCRLYATRSSWDAAACEMDSRRFGVER